MPNTSFISYHKYNKYDDTNATDVYTSITHIKHKDVEVHQPMLLSNSEVNKCL